MESRREGEVGRMRGREVEKMRGGEEEGRIGLGREDEKWKRGEEERRRGEECVSGLWSGCAS